MMDSTSPKIKKRIKVSIPDHNLNSQQIRRGGISNKLPVDFKPWGVVEKSEYFTSKLLKLSCIGVHVGIIPKFVVILIFGDKVPVVMRCLCKAGHDDNRFDLVVDLATQYHRSNHGPTVSALLEMTNKKGIALYIPDI